MSLLNQLQNNKGTVSSSLGKELAQKVLSGDKKILKEAIELCLYEVNNISAKNIRAGAAKIIEKVAEKKPELVAPYLEKLIPALEVAEPQTRWMIIHSFGLCAKENSRTALKSVPYAERFIEARQGVCLTGSAELALGDIGKLGQKEAKKVLPILIKDIKDSPATEVGCILQAFANIFPNLHKEDKAEVIKLVKKYKDSPRKSTQKRVEKLFKIYEK